MKAPNAPKSGNPYNFKIAIPYQCWLSPHCARTFTCWSSKRVSSVKSDVSTNGRFNHQDKRQLQTRAHVGLMFKIPSCCSSIFMNSFLYRGMVMWNQLPVSIRCIPIFEFSKNRLNKWYVKERLCPMVSGQWHLPSWYLSYNSCKGFVLLTVAVLYIHCPLRIYLILCMPTTALVWPYFCCLTARIHNTSIVY